MNRTLKVSLLIAGIFACGVVVGAVGAKRLGQPHRSPGGPEGFGPSVMRRLTAELALTEEQRSTIEPVIKRAGEELRVLRQDSMKRSGAVIEAMNVAVAAELTPEQREKFEILKETQKARMKAIMEERQRRRAEAGERGRDGERDREFDREPGRRPPPPAPNEP